MTVQFGADAGELQWHQKKWVLTGISSKPHCHSGRKERKEQRERKKCKIQALYSQMELGNTSYGLCASVTLAVRQTWPPRPSGGCETAHALTCLAPGTPRARHPQGAPRRSASRLYKPRVCMGERVSTCTKVSSKHVC